MPYGAGFTMALAFNVTAVCANDLPLSVAPVFSVMLVLVSDCPNLGPTTPEASGPSSRTAITYETGCFRY